MPHLVTQSDVPTGGWLGPQVWQHGSSVSADCPFLREGLGQEEFKDQPRGVGVLQGLIPHLSRPGIECTPTAKLPFQDGASFRDHHHPRSGPDERVSQT